MPYSRENVKRLTELLGLIEQNGDGRRAELTYLAVPYLKETDEIVKSQLASESPGSKETLTDSIAVLSYLADAYERLGRFAVSAQYYTRAIALAATLYTAYGEKVVDIGDTVYRALKARNYYVDDDCEDLRALALSFLPKEEVEETFDAVMKRRRSFRHDPVEMTEAYIAVIDEVEEKIEKNRLHYGMGSCHHVWSLKTDYLAQKGIVWHSPAVLNPKVRFD